MDEKQKILTFEIDGKNVALTIARATVRMNSQRVELYMTGDKINAESAEPEYIKRMRVTVFPDLMAATIAADGIPWPMSFDEFLDFDSELADQWIDAIWEMNPHWSPAGIRAAMEGAAGENPKPKPNPRHGSKKK